MKEIDEFWQKANAYGNLSDESRAAWEKGLKRRVYNKNDLFLSEGQVPRTVAFVSVGLFAQSYTSEHGDTIIKRFFPEGYFVASTSALIQKSPSVFSIKALEPSVVLEYNFSEFKQLMQKYNDIGAFYSRYIELHWIIEKEPLEIAFRSDTAKTRYVQFLESYPALEPRLKQYEIASYLGITPTQLSRIRAEL
ncbi:Crp/Fnr family transcriptional regulator [Mucilaginibacter sp. SP1R1]|uniref:Crp/Fnr family transcriptional regulator n=1 Tax=Mucilaginibacter sp. SP1R1 TaxID=2723091 RepID=UPI001819E5AA|nr:Crp/Fnr family transcriptional regulator [Mucilaginibacter sp. SP1R1]MBB6148635.1 CRP-like cAMP-binding protein [Mucilaginibacter sp. SP1R1]